MKAIVYERYGPPEVLHQAEIAQPQPKPGEELVRVHAAALNQADRLLMYGTPSIMRLATGLRWPKRTGAGLAIAGTAGSRRVTAEVKHSGFAEYVAAPADQLAGIPDDVTFEQAATLPVAGTTALQALRLGGVQPGQSVLINGASGGVGTFAVQLAKHLGATVTGVCRTRNIELVRSLGADHTIDYTGEDVTQGEHLFDVVIDIAGNHPLGAVRKVIARQGIYVATSGSGGRVLGPLPRMLTGTLTSPFAASAFRALVGKPNAADLTHLLNLVAAGTIRPVIERVFPLSETAEAMRLLDTAHAQGKIVLTV
jgi:NADPH:quinone reductase-like Zn-dependent oxidoreductase